MSSTPPIFPGATLPNAALLPHRGGLVLALGIVGLVLGCGVGWIAGIIAWVMANTDLEQMDAGIMDPAGRSITQAGKVCGIVSVVLGAVGLFGIALYLLGFLIAIV